MAEVVFTNPFFSIGGVDLSDHVRSLTLGYDAEQGDITAGGDSTRNFIGGLKTWNMALEFNQDFAAAKVDATVFAMVGTTQSLIFRPDAGAVGATNPQFTGTGLAGGYQLGGNIGDVHVSPLTLVPGGSSPNLARATS